MALCQTNTKNKACTERQGSTPLRRTWNLLPSHKSICACWVQEVAFAVSRTLNTCLLLPYRTSLHSLSQRVHCLCWSRDVNRQFVPITQNLLWLAERHGEAPADFQQGAAWQDAELAGVLWRLQQAQQVELSACSGRGCQLQPPLEKTNWGSWLISLILVLRTQHLPQKSSWREPEPGKSQCGARRGAQQDKKKKSVSASDLGNKDLTLGLLPSRVLGSVLFTCF